MCIDKTETMYNELILYMPKVTSTEPSQHAVSPGSILLTDQLKLPILTVPKMQGGLFYLVRVKMSSLKAFSSFVYLIIEV